MRSSLLIMLMILPCSIFSQTNVGGQMSVNTTWDLAGSPYIVSNNILLDSAITLTIDPGVVVKFDIDKMIQVRGIVRAIGSASDSIVFTSNETIPAKGDWQSIYFDTQASPFDSVNLTGSIFNYCIVEYAGSAIANNGAISSSTGAPLIQYCTFRFNGKGGFSIGGSAGSVIIRDNYLFDNDWTTGAGTPGGSVPFRAERNLFVDCKYASFGSYNWFEDAIISDNRFYNTTTTLAGVGEIRRNIVCGGDGVYFQGSPDGINVDIHHNIFANGYHYGQPNNFGVLSMFNDGMGGTNVNFLFRNNAVIDNVSDSSRVIRKEYNIDFVHNTIFRNISLAGTDNYSIANIYGYGSYNFNNIYGNIGKPGSTYYEFGNFRSQSSPDTDCENNWWGTADNTSIQTLIYDWFDNSSKGVVDYSPYLMELDTIAPISPPDSLSVVDLGGGNYQLSWNANAEADFAGYKIYWGSTNCCSFQNSLDLGNVTSYTLTGANPYEIIGVTAYDNSVTGVNDQVNGNESWYTKSTCDYSTLDVEEFIEDDISLINIYPNPNSGNFIISVDASIIGKQYELVDNLGRILHKGRLEQSSNTIDQVDLVQGSYYIQVEESTISIKFIVVE
ncbi:MAG: T9SS type A sorting domain-containing protein [Crocinitomicaceae bacterium]|nr:T9SS type A sorting domain-containing protein [Crocinitomicaceae bacterium]